MRTGKVLITQKGDDLTGYFYEFYEVVGREESRLHIIKLDKSVRKISGYIGYIEIKPIPKRIGQRLVRKIMFDRELNQYYVLVDSDRAYLWDGRPLIVDRYKTNIGL